MSLKLKIENYRGLRKVECTFPTGVSVVVGPNGAGKTTLLKVPELFRHAYERGWSKALEHHGGLHQFKHVAAAPEDSVRLELERGELRWVVDFDGSLDEVGAPVEDVLLAGVLIGSRDDTRAITLANGARVGHAQHSVLRVIADRGIASAAALAHVGDMRCYADFFAFQLRQTGSEYSADTHLHPTGMNVLTVLRNWKDKLATRPRQEFVIEALRDAFPGFLDLEFEATSNVVGALVVSDAFGQATSLRTAANGFIHAMMCLTAVVSAPPGGLVTVDEPETALHPYAIRRVLAAIRDWSKAHQIDVILSTHSPVLIDAMHDDPERLFVFSPADGPGPRPLSELRDAAYLARFSVGDLYSQSRLGGPAEATPTASE
jgi:energy-coupling factor transporter ATP-binding protein EcfA2